MAGRKVRFAVGISEQEISSSFWFLSSHKGCVYMGARPLGGTVKVSFHKDRNSHVRFGPSVELGSLANRYVEKWRRPETPDIGARQVARIFFPTDGLRGKMKGADPGATNLILEPAPPGHAVEVGIYYSRALLPESGPSLEAHGIPLFYESLPSGEIASVTARTIPFEPRNLGVLESLFDSTEATATLPEPIYESPELQTGITQHGALVLVNAPHDDGVLQLVQLTGLVTTRKSARASGG